MSETTVTSKKALAAELAELGLKVKKWEEECPKVLDKNKWTILRVDGHTFHTFVKRFKSLYTEDMTNAMLGASAEWLKEYNGILGYTQSDETTIVIPPVAKPESEMPFSGRMLKICTLSASFFATKFNKFLPEWARGDAHFDCRAFQVSDVNEVADVIRWRQLDAFRNGVSVMSRMIKNDKQTKGFNTRDKINLIESKNDPAISNLKNSHLVHGTFLKKCSMMKTDGTVRSSIIRFPYPKNGFIVDQKTTEWLIQPISIMESINVVSHQEKQSADLHEANQL